MGVHTAIRDDTSMNAVAIEELQARHPDTKLVLLESGEIPFGHLFSGIGGCVHLRDRRWGDLIPRKVARRSATPIF